MRSCSAFGGIRIGNLEYSEIQYRLCVSPTKRVILI
nr:MAG TPA: Sarcoglycan complex subunit protein [Crassvirales sp.]